MKTFAIIKTYHVKAKNEQEAKTLLSEAENEFDVCEDFTEEIIEVV